MKISDLIQDMSAMYLQRTMESFTKDFPKTTVERSRELILANQKEMIDENRIHEKLKSIDTYSDIILTKYIFEALVNKPDYISSEEDLYKDIVTMEREVIKLAVDRENLKYENEKNLEILEAVLEVALEDEHISNEELNLIERLKVKLKISERSTMLLLAGLKHFPKADNVLHDLQDVKDMLKELQKKGIVLFCNTLNGGVYAVPDEIVDSVKNALGIELNKKGTEMLLETLSSKMLSDVLEASNLPKSGTKVELKERIIQAGLKPSICLNSLSSEDLYDLLKKLPGAKVSGSKQEKVDRVIDYFSNLVIKDVDAEATTGEVAFQYFVELAKRDRENLQANKIIRKDIEMEKFFEEGTRYIFFEIFGHEAHVFSGNDHPDGCIRINNRIFMWDNKSVETEYKFPRAHLTQFKRYIRDATDRVYCFLIIVPTVNSEAALVASKLKVESGTDTDIAIIAAEDLKWLAEEWRSRNEKKPFDLNVFNITGILDRQIIKQRMKLLL